MANSVGYHESEGKLRPETQDNHRALTSMQEELEAADWYDQRVDAATDPQLKEILAHNRDEEKEHFAMLLEWYRRRDAQMDGHLKEYPFSSGSPNAPGQAGGGDGGGAPGGAGRGRRHGQLGRWRRLARHRQPEGRAGAMNNLKRELAPISTAAWQEIDVEATRVLKLKLAGRKLVDFEGPLGPTEAAVNTGRRERLAAAPVADVEASRRQVLPLVELRAYFHLSRQEMDAVERGAKDPELQPLIDAATPIACAEDTAIFHGYAAGGIKGIDQVTAYPVLPIPDDYQDYPRSIAEATRLLRLAGVDGPYAIALGPRSYTRLTQALRGGASPVLTPVRELADRPSV